MPSSLTVPGRATWRREGTVTVRKRARRRAVRRLPGGCRDRHAFPGESGVVASDDRTRLRALASQAFSGLDEHPIPERAQ
jgi:hypothetical protein